MHVGLTLGFPTCRLVTQCGSQCPSKCRDVGGPCGALPQGRTHRPNIAQVSQQGPPHADPRSVPTKRQPSFRSLQCPDPGQSINTHNIAAWPDTARCPTSRTGGNLGMPLVAHCARRRKASNVEPCKRCDDRRRRCRRMEVNGIERAENSAAKAPNTRGHTVMGRRAHQADDPPNNLCTI